MHAARSLSTHQQATRPFRNGPLLLRPKCTFPFPPRPHSVYRRRSCLPLPTTRRSTCARIKIGWGRHSTSHEIYAVLITHEDQKAARIGVAELMHAKEDTYVGQSEHSILPTTHRLARRHDDPGFFFHCAISISACHAWSHTLAYTPGTMPQLSCRSVHSRHITDKDDDDEDEKKEKSCLQTRRGGA